MKELCSRVPQSESGVAILLLRLLETNQNGGMVPPYRSVPMTVSSVFSGFEGVSKSTFLSPAILSFDNRG